MRVSFADAVFLQEGPGIRSYEYQKDGYPMINVRCVQDGYIDLSSCNAANVDLATGKWKHFQVDEGDILFTISGSIGRTAIVQKQHLPLLMNTSVIRFRPITPQLEQGFFFYYLQSENFLSRLHALSRGSAQKNVGPTHIKTLNVPLPPLPEQRRIVGILDEAFAGIATAKANAERNLRNARELFESELHAIFGNACATWTPTTLGAVVDLFVGFAFKSTSYTSDGIRLLRGDNIVQGSLRWDDVKRWPASDVEDYARYQLDEGDVVLAMDRPWVKAGLKHAMIALSDLPCLLVQRTARLRAGTKLDRRFLMFLIGSAPFVEHILGVQEGIGVPHISGGQIKDFAFSLPPIKEQHRLAGTLEVLRAETQRLASLYQQKLAALDALKKSLLHQAFSGQLAEKALLAV